MKPFIIASGLILLSIPAFAQGGSPYNSSGSQAGGPRAGEERRMGTGGGSPSMDPAMSDRPKMKTRMKSPRRMKHHRRHHAM
jgi:hypothetical protein